MTTANDWTIIRECFKNEIGFTPEISIESLNGIDIRIKIFKRYRTEKSALEKIEKILVELPLKEIGEIKI